MSGYRINRVPDEELSAPSYIPPNKTYTPTNNPVLAGPIVVVDGLVVLAGIVREINV